MDIPAEKTQTEAGRPQNLGEGRGTDPDPIVKARHRLQHGSSNVAVLARDSHTPAKQSDPPAVASFRIPKYSQLWLVFMPFSP